MAFSSSPTCWSRTSSFGSRYGEKCLILNDFGLHDKARDGPGLGFRDRPALGNLDHVAFLERALRHMRVVLARARDDLAELRVLHGSLDLHHHGLLHLVADHAANQLALVLGIVGRLGSCGCVHFAAFSLMTVRARAISRRTFLIWLVLASCCVACCMRRPNCAFSSSLSSFCSSSPFLARSSLAFMAAFPLFYPSIRCTEAVRNGSLAAASAKASFASAASTPSISKMILPGWISHTKYSGLPLPLPMRTSAGLREIGLSGKTRIQTRPPRLMWRDSVRRAASSWRAVRRPRVVAFRPYSPKATLLPRVAMPVLRPFCC